MGLRRNEGTHEGPHCVFSGVPQDRRKCAESFHGLRFGATSKVRAFNVIWVGETRGLSHSKAVTGFESCHSVVFIGAGKYHPHQGILLSEIGHNIEGVMRLLSNDF